MTIKFSKIHPLQKRVGHADQMAKQPEHNAAVEKIKAFGNPYRFIDQE